MVWFGLVRYGLEWFRYVWMMMDMMDYMCDWYVWIDMLCYVMLCYAMVCYGMLWSAMVCWVVAAPDADFKAMASLGTLIL